jgi:glycosyltransferase involved in cell wall biosynthesis
MIEAMACGTPVIAFRSGSVPEVIDDGITGFVVSGEAEAVEAIGRLSELDRRQVRRHFEKRFRPGGWRRSISAATSPWFIPVPAKFMPAPGPSCLKVAVSGRPLAP